MSCRMYRALAYCRLSKEDGDKIESNSISGQRACCEEYILRQSDMEIAGEAIVDDGFSGVSFERPGFRALEKKMRDGDIDCVVVRDLSRFSRDYIGAGLYLERTFPELGVRFVAINDNYDSAYGDAATNSFLLPFKNLINDMYSRDISVKVRTSLNARRKNGEFVGAFCPYGYRRSETERQRLEVDEAAAETVKLIFSLYGSGCSIREIVTRLNMLAVPSPLEYKNAIGVNMETAFRGGERSKWTYTAVRRILENEVYVGVLVQGKRSRVNHKVPFVRNVETTEWVRVENTHEAIVSTSDFILVSELLRRNIRSSASKRNVFSGYVYCGDCGAAMVCKSVSASGRKYLYYVCSAHKRDRTCAWHSISENELLKVVQTAIKTQISLSKRADVAGLLLQNGELERRVLTVLIDRVLVHEFKIVEIVFRYGEAVRMGKCEDRGV